MLRNYLVTALRNLQRDRLYAAISIASLAVGFAAAVLVGIFLRHELSYDSFLPDHGRLYFARQTIQAPAHGGPWVSNETRIDIAGYLKADFRQVEAVTRLQPQGVAVRVGGRIYPEPDAAWADPNLLDVLKLRLVSGDRRTALSAPDAVVITRALARRYFGDADPIGRILDIHGTNNGRITGALGPGRLHRVTAVLENLPAETHLKARLFTLTPPEALADPPDPTGQEALTYVRLAPGASIEAINRQLPAFVARHIPPGPLMGSSFALRLAPIAELHLPRVQLQNPGDINPPGDRTLLAAAIAAAALILATATVNFVGLATSRAAQRAVEIGVRKCVGAARRHLVLQFLGETLVQVLIAFVAALALCDLLAPAVGRMLGRLLGLDYLRDLPFLGQLAAGALGVGLAAGLYPALVLSAFRPVDALKSGARPSAGATAIRQLLVVVQFAVLVLLMIVIVTLWRQTRLSIGRALGADGRQVLMIQGRPICGAAFEERVRAMSGVREVTCSAGAVFFNNGAEGSARAGDGQAFPIELGPVAPGFFGLFGQRPLAGRVFDERRPADAPLDRDRTADNPPVVLNATAARRFGFATPQAAVGRLVSWDRLSAPFVAGAYRPRIWHDHSVVIGVVPDYAGMSRGAIKPTVYWSDPELMDVLSIRVDAGSAAGVLRAVDRLWRASGHFTAPDLRPFDARVREAYDDVLTLGAIVAACSVVALILAVTGLFALAAFTTERRTKEIGVRKALGASALDIARLLLWGFSKPVLLAAALALPVGWLVMRRWLQGFEDRVAITPQSLAAVIAGALVIAWATVLAHSWRVARERPVDALRYE